MVRVMTDDRSPSVQVWGARGTCAAPQETLEQLNELAAETDWRKRRHGREENRSGQHKAHVRTVQAQERRAHQRVQQEQQEAAMMLHQFHTQNLEAQPPPRGGSGRCRRM
jgi:predicted nucleotidyltransferase